MQGGTDPVLPEKGGRPPVATELVLQALLYRIREGCSWRSLSIFAPHTTLYTRWKQWCERGIWDRILEHLSEKAGGKLWAIDSNSVKVHKHGNGAAKGAGPQSIGRSRGGINTKVHALVDGRGKAIRIVLSPGNRHDLISAPELVEGYSERTILADKAYDSDGFRKALQKLGLKACIPPKSNRKNPARFHRGHYKHRHKVENLFQRIKEKRAIATRYEKLDSRYLALVTLAAICDWIKL